MTTTTKRQRHSNIMASAKFADHQQAALDLLQQLTADIERLQEEFDDGGRTDWSFVGSMAHVREQLQEAHDFLTNTDEE